MKESYVEGLATHSGPESCVATRKGGGEAWTWGTCGPGIEPRNTAADSLWPDPFPPSPPPPVARPCSGTSPVLRACPTSHVRFIIGVCPQTSRCGPQRPSLRTDMGPPGSRARCFRACTGSLTARDSHAPRDIGAPDVAFRFLLQRRLPGGKLD